MLFLLDFSWKYYISVIQRLRFSTCEFIACHIRTHIVRSSRNFKDLAVTVALFVAVWCLLGETHSCDILIPTIRITTLNSWPQTSGALKIRTVQYDHIRDTESYPLHITRCKIIPQNPKQNTPHYIQLTIATPQAASEQIRTQHHPLTM